MHRYTHARAILGPTLHARLAQTRVLVVGAGGIGCELLKNVVLTGFGDITLLDLDTIDLSNLNRQFLFRKKDVKQSKAMVAARTASAFNPSCKITPIHGNVKDEQYDVAWFKGFHIVLNALDNLEARRHVNKMCMAASVPLIESGTAGYIGQVQPLLKNETECFDCMPKDTPKTFPVCTIRSTPSTPIHCIVWAKSYLLPQLFGEQDDDEGELDQAAAAGENATEIAALKKEAAAFKQVRKSLLSSEPQQAAEIVFDKVFNQDIRRLLSMSDMWKSRRPPTPLDRTEILNGVFLPTQSRPAKDGSRSAKGGSRPSTNGANGVHKPSGSNLKDQQRLSLTDNLALFDDSLNRLAARLRSGKEPSISFDKDDDDTLDFVTASANLRASSYAIENKTRFEVKEMAGNIIPAIATTNAVIAGLIVLQALHVLRMKGPSDAKMESVLASPTKLASSSSRPKSGVSAEIRNASLQTGKPSIPLGTYSVSPPNPQCGVCRDTYVSVGCDPARVTLGDIVGAALDAEAAAGDDHVGASREVSVYEGTRMLCDPDWDDNLDRSLDSLGCGRGKFLTIVDDDNIFENVVLCLIPLPENHNWSDHAFTFPPTFPKLRPKPVKPAPPLVEKIPQAAPPRAVKRSAPDEGLPPAKRSKVSNNGNGHVSDNEDVILISDDEDEDIVIL